MILIYITLISFKNKFKKLKKKNLAVFCYVKPSSLTITGNTPVVKQVGLLLVTVRENTPWGIMGHHSRRMLEWTYYSLQVFVR